MEDSLFVPHKLTKSETKQQQQQPNTRRSSSGRGNNAKQQHADRPAAGQVAFRLLCHVHTAGGVIGSSGSVVKNLETLTGCKILFEDGLRNCTERVINIVGDAAVEKKMSIGGGAEDETVDVSKAQEGLMRVFERVLEVKGNGGANNNENDDITEHHSDGFVGCRLLAPKGLIGALMGKGGKVVEGIRKSSGTKIRVLKKEQTPACAGLGEELIQIMGGVVAVKKALLAVSQRLQERTLGKTAQGHISPHGVLRNLEADFTPKDSPKQLPSSGNAVEHNSTVGHSLSTDANRFLNLNEDSSQIKVVFRVLCSNGLAGGVIGKGANIVKFLEKETGASIKFAPPVSGSKERLAIISALENPDALYSPAQIAIVRIFSRYIEVALDQGVISSLSNGVSVSARILVPSRKVGCLVDESGRVASDISIASGAEIRLMETDRPGCAGEDDNVIQITSDYENVKSALFQLTGRLREQFFSQSGPKGAECKDNLCSAIIHSSSSKGREAASSMKATQLSQLPDIDSLDHLGFIQKSSDSHIPVLPHEQASSRGSTPTPVNSAPGFVRFPTGLKNESIVGNKGSKQKVEVVIPGEVFGFVYGENGSNLARLKEISGATVVLKDPCRGESSGKVIISGTPERIQIAQSLLQAFISF